MICNFSQGNFLELAWICALDKRVQEGGRAAFFSKHLFRGSTVYSVNYLHGLIHSHQSYVLLYQLSYIKLKLKFMIIKQLKDIY